MDQARYERYTFTERLTSTEAWVSLSSLVPHGQPGMNCQDFNSPNPPSLSVALALVVYQSNTAPKVLGSHRYCPRLGK